jgi:DNA-binding transcriptional regulator YhcF (GntR family)
MLKWIIDKDSKLPLYLQLKDLIKYYISTGAIQNNDQLPGVVHLAEELKINFETVRKAYKELEKEGLLSMKRGKGTFLNGHAGIKPQLKALANSDSNLVEFAKLFIKDIIEKGASVEKARAIINQALHEVSLEFSRRFTLFTECNQLQVNQISNLLKTQLNVNVKGVLLQDLKPAVKKASDEDSQLLAVLTTGFHVNEVRNALGDTSVKIDFVITNMSPETRRELEVFDKNSRFGFICRDSESIAFYKDMLKAELNINSELSCCTLQEEAEVKSIFESVDALLLSPPVFEEIKQIAPASLPVFNVFDRVDPMSIMVVKERLIETASV